MGCPNRIRLRLYEFHYTCLNWQPLTADRVEYFLLNQAERVTSCFICPELCSWMEPNSEHMFICHTGL